MDRIVDIMEAIDDLNLDIGTMTRERFVVSGTVRRAVERGFTVIGEAATKLIQEQRHLELANPELWEQLFVAKDMRNTVVHEYFNPDPEVLWDTVHKDIPTLRACMSAFRDQMEREIQTERKDRNG
jgi:uncharacterized protein with HEPN domain